ncbi:hypothetical protein C8J57DRAFT_1599963 [Mycena rebaudengoi]|nr:hypothetical protein C8J57DRAFT_1599963 [Mycena rebaudengoi]
MIDDLVLLRPMPPLGNPRLFLRHSAECSTLDSGVTKHGFHRQKTGRALAQVTDEKQLEGRELEDEGAYRAWRLDDGARIWRDFSKRLPRLVPPSSVPTACARFLSPAHNQPTNLSSPFLLAPSPSRHTCRDPRTPYGSPVRFFSSSTEPYIFCVHFGLFKKIPLNSPSALLVLSLANMLVLIFDHVPEFATRYDYWVVPYYTPVFRTIIICRFLLMLKAVYYDDGADADSAVIDHSIPFASQVIGPLGTPVDATLFDEGSDIEDEVSVYAEDPFVAGLVMMSNAPAAREEDKAVVLQNSNSRSEVHPRVYFALYKKPVGLAINGMAPGRSWAE